MYIPWFFQWMYTFPEWIRVYTYTLKFSGYIHIPWLYTFPVTYIGKGKVPPSQYWLIVRSWSRFKAPFSTQVTIVINLAAGSPAPLSILRPYARPVLTFATFWSSHLLTTNCSQFTDPRRDGGFGWPVVHPRFYSPIDSTGNRNPDLMRKSRHKQADALSNEPWRRS